MNFEPREYDCDDMPGAHDFPVPGDTVLYDDGNGSPTPYRMHHIEDDDVFLVKDNKYYFVQKEHIYGHTIRSAPKFYCHFVLK